MSTVTQKTDAEPNSNEPPKLNFDLLKPENLPSLSNDWPEHVLPVDILLVTGEKHEHLSCLSHLDKESMYKSFKMGIGHVFFGKIGTKQKDLMKIAVMECHVGAIDTSIAVLKAVEELGPKAVICVGFCGALDDTKVDLGDVVISKKVRTYASVSVMEEGIKDHNIAVPVPAKIGGVLIRADDGWKPPLKNPEEFHPTIYKEGVFLSGPEQVNNKKRCDELVKLFADAVAIERQGEGLYSAAHDRGIQWAVIKGVSNFIDGRERGNTDSWREFASAMAASLTFNMIKDANVFNRWLHHESQSQESRSKKKESWGGHQGSKRVESQTRPLPAPCATCTGTLPTAAQTQMTVVPQAQPSVLMQVPIYNPNNQVLYAAPGAIPVHGIVPQVVAQNPTQHQSGMVATALSPAVPSVPEPGQVDVNTAAPHGVPAVQAVQVQQQQQQQQKQQQLGVLPRLMDIVPGAPHQRSPSVVKATGAPTNARSVFPDASVAPQHSATPVVSNNPRASQLQVQQQQRQQQQRQLGVLPRLMDIVPGAPHQRSPSVVKATGALTNARSVFPNASVAPQHSATPVVSNSPRASQLQVQQQQQHHQQRQFGLLPPLMDIVPGAPRQRSPSVFKATGAPTNARSVFPNASVAPKHSAPPAVSNSPRASQLQVQQQQQQQQQQRELGMLPCLMDIVPGAPHQRSPFVVTATGAPTNARSVFPDASVAPQHSATPVVSNSPRASQLVTAPGWYPQPSQKRAADGDAGQQGSAVFHNAVKRLRF